MTRLIQLRKGESRRVAVVEEPRLRLLTDFASIYSLAQAVIEKDIPWTSLIREKAVGELLEYDPIYEGRSEWHVLPPIDHPEPSRCLISGTGLTHLGSAQDRQDMHKVDPRDLTDSMKMFQLGIERGRPQPGQIGVSPEWFYKGSGTSLRSHNEPLGIPDYAEDGGEEAEIAGIYVIDSNGHPRRIGMAAGNEFSDHRVEKRNYLYLASSKLRTCSLGPELVIDPEFQSVAGEVGILRGKNTLWSRHIRTGEANMCHTLQNIEHHHFKYAPHRRIGDVHIHFFGADLLSFREGVRLADGDIMRIQFEGFGRALRNPVRVSTDEQRFLEVIPLK